MKISEVSLSNIKDFCGVTGDDSDTLLEALKASAISFISNYTALTDEQMDELPELTLAMMTLVNEAFTNRMLTVEESRLNPFVESILDMHRRNLL